MIRLSPTKLAAYVDFAQGKPYMSRDAFRGVVLGVTKPNVHLVLGSAVHAIMEGDLSVFFEIPVRLVDAEWQQMYDGYKMSPPEASYKYERDGMSVVFNKVTFEQLVYYAAQVNAAAYEQKLRLELDTCFGPVQINMRADAVDGLTLHEFKTSMRTKKWRDYDGKIQTLCYQAALGGMQEIKYHVFMFTPLYELRTISVFRYLANSSALDKVRRVAEDMIAFCKEDDLLWQKINFDA